MLRRTVSGIFLMLIMLNLLTLAFEAKPAKANPATYTRAYAPNEWVSGGSTMGWYADDNSWPYTVPFDFPFYGTNYRTIYISSNGLITFSADSGWSNSISGLVSKLAIAPAWDDWLTYSPNDIYIWQPDSNKIIIRWDARHISSGAACNFEAVLGADGIIRFNYGENSGPISATVGISDGTTEILATEATDLNYASSVLFTPFRPEPDLVVYQETPDFVQLGCSTTLNTTVQNLGSKNETNVELQLLINDIIVNSAIIPELMVGSSYTISYSWTPSGEGLYNVTSYAPTIPDESATTNNVATKLVEVAHQLINPVEGQWADYEVHQFDDASGQITGTMELNFNYDHYVSPNEIYITMSSMSNYGQNTTGWMIVNTLNRLVESDSGIYWTGMWYPGWIETNVTVGSTVNLLGGTATVVGSDIVFALEHGIYPIDCWRVFLMYSGFEYSFWFDKASGLWVRMENTMYPYRAELTLLATNVPLVRHEHDLAVVLEAPNLVSLDDLALLNATVYNLGLSDETDVRLFLLIDGAVVDSSMTPELPAGSSYTISHSWIPTAETDYNITAYASPLPDETITQNNVAATTVNILTIEATFREDFNTFALDPHWQVWRYGVPAPSPADATYQQEARYSLTDNPGFLRYYPGSWTQAGNPEPVWGDPNSTYWYYPSAHISRAFQGTEWMLETKITYYAPYSNAAYWGTFVRFGNSVHDSNNLIGIEVFTNDYSDHYVRLVDNGVQKAIVHLPIFGYEETPTPWSGYHSPYWDMFYYRIIRSGYQFTVQWSHDGYSYNNAFTETMGPQIDGLPQFVDITGQAFWSDPSAYSEHDYISVGPQLPTYDLTVTSSTGGTTNPAPGTYSYMANSLAQVTAIPEAGYMLDHWELDGITVGSANPYTAQMENSHTVRAVFTRILLWIYIWSDGTIDPIDAPIYTLDNITYTVTDNIDGSIIVWKDNIVIDGNGYTLQGSGSGNGAQNGIDLSGRENVTVRNIKIAAFDCGMLLRYSSNNTIVANTVTGCSDGIWLDSWLETSSNNTISGNALANNDCGILLRYSSNGNSISGNDLINNSYGVWLDSSNNNSISGNNVAANNYRGIWLGLSSSNTVSENSISNNGYGIYVSYYSNNNVINGNNVTDNNYGIWLSHSSNNKAFHNNFLGNTYQAYSSESTSIWDDGYPSGGNYWSEYAGVDDKRGRNQDQPGSDGIGDTSYVIDTDNRDNYPLMEQFTLNVAPAWDINQDGYCNAKDVIVLGRHFGAQSGTPDYLWTVDLNVDGYIDARDAVILGVHFGEHW